MDSFPFSNMETTRKQLSHLEAIDRSKTHDPKNKGKHFWQIWRSMFYATNFGGSTYFESNLNVVPDAILNGFVHSNVPLPVGPFLVLFTNLRGGLYGGCMIEHAKDEPRGELLRRQNSISRGNFPILSRDPSF